MPSRVAALTVAVALLLTAVALGLLGGGSFSAQASHPTKPNVLLIVTDDMRNGQLALRIRGIPGVAVGNEPRWMEYTMQRFVERGTRYTNAFATTPVCCPSRASIFTGRYAHNHGVTSNAGGGNLRQDTTLQYYLSRQPQPGYRTGIAGKYLNAVDIGQPPAYFDKWSVIEAPRDVAPPHYGFKVNEGGTVKTYPDTGSANDKYSTTYVAEQAEKFITEWSNTDASKPWFLVVTPIAPHFPFTPERGKYDEACVPEFERASNTLARDRGFGKHPAITQLQDQALANTTETERRIFGDCIVDRKVEGTERNPGIRTEQLKMLRSIDDLVKRVFDKLEATGEADDTLAVFTSDNGFMWGEHGLEGKLLPYFPSVNVPLLMRWTGQPAHVNAGGFDFRVAANIDIAPTILDAAGISPPQSPIQVDGRSLLLNPSPAWAAYSSTGSHGRNHLLLESPGQYGTGPPLWASIRGFGSPNYQYTEYYAYEDPDNDGVYVWKSPPIPTPTFKEYYENDPSELSNLFDNSGANPPPQRAGQAATLLGRAITCKGQQLSPSEPLAQPCP